MDLMIQLANQSRKVREKERDQFHFIEAISLATTSLLSNQNFMNFYRLSVYLE